jgi:hypothetical protein
MYLDRENGLSYDLKQYIANSEQFVLLSSQEIQQNSNLKSIEFGLNSIGNISIIVN